MKLKPILLACMAMALTVCANFAYADGATVVSNDQSITIDEVLSDPIDLWVSPEDLTRINGFVLKPEGACLDEICIPVKQDQDSKLFVKRFAKSWVNVTELARMLQQPFVSDTETSTWSFGAVPQVRQSFLKSAVAPDFAIADRNGEIVRLSDFRGKKVFLVTWASW